MEDLILFVVVFLIFSFSAFLTIYSLLRQTKIRRAIRKNKLLLTRMREKEADGKFHTYNDLLSGTLVNLRNRVKGISYEKLKDIIDKEINNLVCQH